MLHRRCVFASGETSKHYFSCSGGPGVVSTKKRPGTSYAEHMLLHPVGSVGHVLHSATSGA
jgi:hypothetical protein